MGIDHVNHGLSQVTDHPISHRRSPTLRAVLTYQALDSFSGWLLLMALIFSPWAFGTTQPWSIWTMNVVGYVLGVLLAGKLFLRSFQGYDALRWGGKGVDGVGSGECGVGKLASTFNLQPGRGNVGATLGLAAISFGILLYCLIAALNARYVYQPDVMRFDVRSHVAWLPHSYDRARSFQVFWEYLALAAFFWAARDWLLGKTAREVRADKGEARSQKLEARSYLLASSFYLPGRLRWLLWVLTINGALLGLESIAQRLSDTNQLLWFMPTRINAAAEYQFGPYAYRGNAAQYFNLIWPVAVAFWWVMRKAERGVRSGECGTRKLPSSFYLLASSFIMAACPLITLSRGGALVAFGNLAIISIILVFALRRQNPLTRFGVVLFFAGIGGFGLWFGWEKLGVRLKESGEGLRNREATYETARQIARDFPLFGTGPGTFESVFQVYRGSVDESWPRQLHNDWLETRITFGWVGSSLIGLAFLLAVTRWFGGGGGIRTGWRFNSLLWLGLGGCLIHARYDFPFQIYSIVLAFLMICAVLSVTRRRVREESSEG